MFAFALSLATLSLLVLGAHFLREGGIVQCAAALGAVAALLFTRRTWALRLAQGVLALGAMVWVSTTVKLVQQRVAEGGDARRLGIILGAVLAVDVLALVLLLLPRVSTRYQPVAATGAQPPAN